MRWDPWSDSPPPEAGEDQSGQAPPKTSSGSDTVPHTSTVSGSVTALQQGGWALNRPWVQANQVGHLICSCCTITLMYAWGAQSVKCAVCNHITPVNSSTISGPPPHNPAGGALFMLGMTSFGRSSGAAEYGQLRMRL